METTAKSVQHRSTDRLIEALSTLAALLDRTINEVKALDSEFQSRLLQAVHDTEVSLQQQAAEHLKQSLEEADQKVRAQLTALFETEMTSTVEKLRQELEAEKDKLSRELDRTTQAAVKSEEERARLVAERDQARQAAAEAISAKEKAEAQAAEEVKVLDSEFQSRMLQAVHDTKLSVQRQAAEHLQQSLEEANQKVRDQVTKQMSAQFETEMTTTIEKLRKELEAETDRLSWELDRATQAAGKWEEERSRLVAERDQARRTAAESKSAQEKAEAQAADIAAAQAAAAPDPRILESIKAEITRVEAIIKNISALIDDPATELATVIRKNVERAELESYLRGIRFASNGR